MPWAACHTLLFSFPNAAFFFCWRLVLKPLAPFVLLTGGRMAPKSIRTDSLGKIWGTAWTQTGAKCEQPVMAQHRHRGSGQHAGRATRKHATVAKACFMVICRRVFLARSHIYILVRDSPKNLVPACDVVLVQAVCGTARPSASSRVKRLGTSLAS